MGWPTPNDYDEAAENLRHSMSDEELRAGQAALDDQQLPMVWAGNFASVYRIDCPATGKSWALKCFTREVSVRQERYRHIAAALEAARLPFTVPFVYLDRGIQVHGQWYPAVKMEWVEGQTLNRFVEESLEKPKMLRQLLDLWPKLAARLGDAGIAHADLQHGNVLLVPTPDGKLALKLIDYDGMYVPSLAGTSSGEMGHPNYQHPQRVRQRAYNVHVDRFSHLVIFSTVHCLLSGNRDLWKRFNNDENLLFREHDFQAPERSELFRALSETHDPSVRGLVGRLALACKQPLEEVPWLDELVVNGRVRPLTRKEESQVAEVLAVGKATVAVAPQPVGGAAAIAGPPPLPVKTHEPATSDTRPATAEGTVPATPPPGSRLRTAGNRACGGFAAMARPFDALLRRLVGEENDVLRYFLWAFFPLLLVAAVWLAASTIWQTSSVPPTAKLKLRAIASQTVEAGKPLTVTVTPENADAWKVNYSLGPDSPSGATIDAQTGVFHWTPRRKSTSRHVRRDRFGPGHGGPNDHSSFRSP